ADAGSLASLPLARAGQRPSRRYQSALGSPAQPKSLARVQNLLAPAVQGSTLAEVAPPREVPPNQLGVRFSMRPAGPRPRVDRRSAIFFSSSAAGDDGSLSTSGVPLSPPSRSRVSRGTW